MERQGYKDLIVWQKGMMLVKLTYKLCDQLPIKEEFRLVSQMIRAAISIPSNIAEGWARNRRAEFVRFLEIAYASSAELETQYLVTKDRYPNLDYEQVFATLTEVQKMLNKLIQNNKNFNY